MVANDAGRKDTPLKMEVPSNDVRVRFSMWLNRTEVRGDRVVVLRHGKPVAALVSIADLEKIEAA